MGVKMQCYYLKFQDVNINTKINNPIGKMEKSFYTDVPWMRDDGNYFPKQNIKSIIRGVNHNQIEVGLIQLSICNKEP